VTAYAEWVLGPSRGATLRHVVTEADPDTGAILARNPFSLAFADRVAFADLGAGIASHSADRAETLGIGGSMANPEGIGAAPLSGRSGPALDPCAALQRRMVLAPGDSVEVLFLLGQADSREAARELILRHRATDPEVTLAEVKQHWADLLGAEVPFIEGPALLPGVHDDFFLPSVSDQSASLFEHCARGLDQAIVLTGENGIPLIGTGDWNDGMNRVARPGAARRSGWAGC
jgi:cellobiose phosphorylase